MADFKALISHHVKAGVAVIKYNTHRESLLIANKWKNAIVVICFAAFMGCGGGSNYAPVVQVHYQAPTPRDFYRVRQGDTLYSIAFSFGQDYRILAAINHIRPPYAIRPGQLLRIKPSYQTSRQAIIKQGIKPKAKQKTTVKPPKKVPVKSHFPASAKHALKAIRRWYWPASGKIIAAYAPNKGNKGINIANHSGAPIYATAAGVVVYEGTGLRGYGKLIIVKHNTEYLSAYAHNRRILVEEGQYVRAHQKIAEMGRSGAAHTMLHFEIRRAGKSVNPVKLLPTR